MKPPQPRRVVILGLGNEYRRDDGVGRAAARSLRAEAASDVTVSESRGEGTAWLDAWDAADSVFLLDAVQSPAEPGAIYRFEAQARPLPACLIWDSSHSLGIAEAIELARALGHLPARLVVYGIAGRDFGDGIGLSPEVARAAEVVAGQVRQEIHDWRQGRLGREPEKDVNLQSVEKL